MVPAPSATKPAPAFQAWFRQPRVKSPPTSPSTQSSWTYLFNLQGSNGNLTFFFSSPTDQLVEDLVPSRLSSSTRPSDSCHQSRTSHSSLLPIMSAELTKAQQLEFARMLAQSFGTTGSSSFDRPSRGNRGGGRGGQPRPLPRVSPRRPPPPIRPELPGRQSRYEADGMIKNRMYTHSRLIQPSEY